MEEKKGLVSIILNCYNGEKYLQDAIDTILSQSYSEWELIFWDNRSSDNSKKIFDSYKSNKFRYFLSKQHTTLYEARNFALKECRGEYIAFLDADDTWEKNKLEKQIKLFNNDSVGVVYGNLWIYNERLKKKKIFAKSNLLKGKINSKIFSDYKIGVITTIIRKKVLLKNKINFESQYNHIGDFDLFIKLSKVSEFDAVQEPVATYRVHGENLSLKNVDQEISEMKYWVKLNENNLDINQFNQFKSRIFNREFISIKFKNDFIKTSMFFFEKRKYLMKSFKNYLILFTPVFILKKIMWYQ
tara:strand:- start:183 stop:1082 length:900 start_codon:yes stop_codon:yes gene_type:complete